MAIEFITKEKTTSNMLAEQVGTVEVPFAVQVAIDTYVSTKKEVDELKLGLKPLEASVKGAQTVINGHAEDIGLPAGDAMHLKGVNHTLQLSARTKVVGEVDLDKVIKILGPEAFLKIAKVGITDLRKYLTEAQFKDVAEEGLTGTRRIKVVD